MKKNITEMEKAILKALSKKYETICRGKRYGQLRGELFIIDKNHVYEHNFDKMFGQYFEWIMNGEEYLIEELLK